MIKEIDEKDIRFTLGFTSLVFQDYFGSLRLTSALCLINLNCRPNLHRLKFINRIYGSHLASVSNAQVVAMFGMKQVRDTQEHVQAHWVAPHDGFQNCNGGIGPSSGPPPHPTLATRTSAWPVPSSPPPPGVPYGARPALVS